MANSNTEYQVRVIFQTVLGNLERDTRRVIQNLRNVGDSGRRAGREGSEGLDDLSDSADDASDHLRRTEDSAVRLSNTIKTAFKALVVGYVGKQLVNFGKEAVNEYGKTQKALGEVASLGFQDMEGLESAAVKFSNTWSGTTREDFISAAYDIKSGISSLTDEGVAKFTELSGLTAKATKASTAEMTSLFATGYGIYRKFYESDTSFGEAFSAGIAKSVQQFKTDGTQMAGAIQTLGASASSANVPLGEQLSILGMLQGTMSGSESGTKYKAFLQSAAKAGKELGLEFLDANNQLKSMPEILDQLRGKFGDVVDATEKMQLTKAFGTAEAVSLIDLLYEKTDDLRNNMDAVGQSIQGGTKSVEEMANKMNGGMLEKMQLIKQSWGNLLNEMGKQMEPGVSEGLDKVRETLIELQESGDFSRLGESLGRLVQAGAELFAKVLDRAPDAIDAMANAAEWLADNLDLVAFAVKTAVIAWASFKTASAVTKIFKAIGGSVTRLVTLFRSGAGAINILKTALKAGFKTNALGIIITLVISLISWFFKATEGVEGFKNKCNAAWLDVQEKFERMIKKIKTAFKGFLGLFGIEWKKLNDSIDKSERRIAGLKDEKESLRGDKAASKNPVIGMIGKGTGIMADAINQKLKQPSSSGSSGAYSDTGSGVSSGGASGGSGGAATTIQDRIDAIDDQYADTLENLELKADLAEGDNKTSEVKGFKQAAIEYLKKQANDLLSLEGTQSGNNRTVVENARLAVMKKIQELTQDIRDGVEKLTGEFNTPSDIKAMTKYEYMVAQGGAAKGQYFNNGNVEMYFNIKNPDGLTTDQLKEYILNWAITGAATAGNVSYDQAKAMASQVTRV